MTLDLGKRRKATYLAVNQTEWSPTHARESFGRPEDSARIKDYQVSVSNDGEHWGKPVRTSAMPSARGVQFIDIGNQIARYLKLEVLNTWGGPQAPPFYQQLRIDEIKVGYGYPVPERWRTRCRSRRRRRRTSGSGGARIDLCAACSGSAQVTGLGRGSGHLPTESRWLLRQLPASARRTTTSAAASFSVRVNGGAPLKAPVDAGNPDVPGSTAIAVPLKAGSNTIQVSSDDTAARRLTGSPSGRCRRRRTCRRRP